jgi:hypothetical protein
VNHRRHDKIIDGRSLHDYVPLYWATHTPMQYVQTIRDGVLAEDELVVFVLLASLVLEFPGVITTDGNAASNETAFYSGNGALPFIHWDKVFTRNAWSRDFKWRKCAEVLVPDQVPTSCFRRVVVRTNATPGTLERSIRELHDRLPGSPRPPTVVADPAMYYS